MKNRKNFWKLLLTAMMLISIVSPSAVLAQEPPFIPESLIKSEAKLLVEYAALLQGYARDCESLKNEPRPNGEQLKRCVTVAKSLLDKLEAFRHIAERLREKIKGIGKWTAELDEDFIKNGVRRGHDAKLVDYMRRNGGVRAVFDKNLGSLDQVKVGLREEIKILEELQKKFASVPSQSGEVRFATASVSSPSAARIKWGCVALFVTAAATAPLAATVAGAVVPGALNAAGFACLAN